MKKVKELIPKRPLFFLIIIGLLLVTSILLYNSYSLTEPVDKVSFASTSLDYTSKAPGSWNVEEKAVWIDKGQARVTLDLESIIKTNESIGSNYRDIILILDISDSMTGEQLDKVKKDTSELVSSLLMDSNNQVSLIVFDSKATVVSPFTNDKASLLSSINNLQTITGEANYYYALSALDTVLNGYQNVPDRDCMALFLTDGYPNAGVPNEENQYTYLKNKYPFLTINGIQYEAGENVLEPIKKISDRQYLADMKTLNNVLFDAVLSRMTYDKLILTEYINDEFFEIESIDKIKPSTGEVALTYEGTQPKVSWDLSGIKSGDHASLIMDVKLKDSLISADGLYPIILKETVEYQISETTETVESSLTPILKNHYQVTFDWNPPEGCTLSETLKTETRLVFDVVPFDDTKTVCEGYQFKGWKFLTSGVEQVNGDFFLMPEKDVIIRAEWSKSEISKTMDGTVSSIQPLYQMMADHAVLDNIQSEFVSNTTGIDFSNISSDTNGKGIYEVASTQNDPFPIYYYRGNVEDNNVKFANFCWKIVRTTETGGVKLLYNGTPDSNGYCNATGTETQLPASTEFNLNANSPTYNGYMYGESYPSQIKDIGIDKWYEYSGKTILEKTGMGSTIFYYSDTVTHKPNNNRYTLDNAIAYDWNGNYANLKGKYTCLRTNNPKWCDVPAFIVDVTSDTAYYVELQGGETKESIVADLQQNLRWIYGNDVTYQNGTYTLTNTIASSPVDWETDKTSIGNGFHYTCFSNSNTCDTVYYIFNSSGKPYHLTLTNGEKIEDVVSKMDANINDSKIKTVIDQWYLDNMTTYIDRLEDTVWCNDRSYGNSNGWTKDGNANNPLYYSPYTRLETNYQPDFTCTNIRDRFTVSDTIGNGLLTYPVGLLTADEVTYAGGRYGSGQDNSNYYLYTNQDWWLMSPYFFNNDLASGFAVDSYGALNDDSVSNSYGVRPIISLKPGIRSAGGNGTVGDPFVVK